MLTAIDFDHQPMSEAAEIHDVATNWMLAAKLEAAQAFGAQVLPKQAFGRGLFAAQTAHIGTKLFVAAHNKMWYGRVWELIIVSV
jgi:hypothetical protein